MSHPLTADLFSGDFDAASVAYNSLVANALILAAVALPVLYRAEYFFAEEAIFFGLIRPIINCLGFEHFAV